MAEYKLNDRVEYYVFRDGKKYHRLGYVKGHRKAFFWERYIVVAADRTREVDEIKAEQILCYAPKKENVSKCNDNQSKPTTNNEF